MTEEDIIQTVLKEDEDAAMKWLKEQTKETGSK